MKTDLLFLWRTAKRYKISFLAIIVSLSLSIRLTTTIYGFLDALGLHPLNVKDADRTIR